MKKMNDEFDKSYEEILKDRDSNKSTELVTTGFVNPADLIRVGSVTELLTKADSLIPALNKSLLSETDGMTAADGEKWLALVPEALHSIKIAPNRRTMSEKKLAVLQSNRFVTAGARFHQSVLEQSVYTGQLIENNLNLKSAKIKLEKMLYKYRKRQEKIQEMKDSGEDTFLEECDLELYQLKVVKEIMALKGAQGRNNMLHTEIAEWSQIKEELFQEAQASGEVWSPDGVDEGGSQEIPLALRHFSNFIIQVQNPDGADISSVLNIQGLCLTAFKQGIKENKLGLFLCQLADSQISLIWERLYGKKVEVIRQGENIVFHLVEDQQFMTFPATVAAYNNAAQKKDETV